MLDLFQQISSLMLGREYLNMHAAIIICSPPGYNHSAIVEAFSQPNALLSLINRPALGLYPPADFTDRLKNSLLSVAPPGLGRVCTQMCGTCANENAFKAAFIKYMVSIHGYTVGLTGLSGTQGSLSTNKTPMGAQGSYTGLL